MPNDVLTRGIDAVASGEHLTADHAAAVLAEIMEGRAGEVQTGAFLIALRAKGETVPELVGLARTMRSLATIAPADQASTDFSRRMEAKSSSQRRSASSPTWPPARITAAAPAASLAMASRARIRPGWDPMPSRLQKDS